MEQLIMYFKAKYSDDQLKKILAEQMDLIEKGIVDGWKYDNAKNTVEAIQKILS
jgi:RPA family protein